MNSDQKTAVAKYDEVLQTLDITRDLYKQIANIANDYVKQQKKLARKEALERTQQDIAKVQFEKILHIILCMIKNRMIKNVTFVWFVGEGSDTYSTCLDKLEH